MTSKKNNQEKTPKNKPISTAALLGLVSVSSSSSSSSSLHSLLFSYSSIKRAYYNKKRHDIVFFVSLRLKIKLIRKVSFI